MDYKTYFKLLKSQALPGVLLLEGEEEYVKESALAQLRAALLPEGLEAMNEVRLLADANEQQITAACETLPFMAEKRLVVVVDHPLTLPSKKAETDEDEAPAPTAAAKKKPADDGLHAYIAKVPPTAMLVFYVRGKADMKKKLNKAIDAAGGAVHFDPLTPSELTSHINRKYGAYHKSITAEAAAELIVRAGPLLTGIDTQAKKLIDYLGDRPETTLDDVETLLNPNEEAIFYLLTDAILQGNKQKALTMLIELDRRGEANPHSVLAGLTKRVKLMAQIKGMADAGESRQAIAAALAIKDGYAGALLSATRGTTLAKLNATLDRCIAAHADLFSRRKADGEDAFYALLFELMG